MRPAEHDARWLLRQDRSRLSELRLEAALAERDRAIEARQPAEAAAEREPVMART